MPLSTPAPRRGVHHRVIDMRAYAREDGLYDVEARLVDDKPFAFYRRGNPEPVPPGEPMHDLWIRLTVDGSLTVRDVEVASDVTPYGLCKQAESTLRVMVGERIVAGWSAKVKERLRGAASCTHLMEMLLPLASTALQGIGGLKARQPLVGDEKEAARKIDSCYAYRRDGEVVQMLWPQQGRP